MSSNWTSSWPSKLFAHEFAAAQIRLRNALNMEPPSRVLITAAAGALDAALDHMPLELQAAILEVRSKVGSQAISPPPRLRTRRED